MKNFDTKEYYTDFSTLPFWTVCRFDNPDERLTMLNKVMLDYIDRHVSLKRTKFTRPPAPWMKQLDIIELQKQRDKFRFLPHSIPNKENWINFRNGRNKLKKKNKRQKNSILQENSNIAKIKRNLENCSPYLKPKQHNFWGRYKRVKHIFQSNRETSSNNYTVQQWWTKESYWVFSRQK